MNALNPELESQVDALAKLCCSALARQLVDIDTASHSLIEALVKGGYARLSNINLQSRLETRVLDQCRETAIHRRGEIAGITGVMQAKFDKLVLWETQTPRSPSGTKAANISAATDA